MSKSELGNSLLQRWFLMGVWNEENFMTVTQIIQVSYLKYDNDIIRLLLFKTWLTDLK